MKDAVRFSMPSQSNVNCICDELQIKIELDNILDNNAIATYYKGKRFGSLSIMSMFNLNVYAEMTKHRAYGIEYALFPLNILNELEPEVITSISHGD